MNQLIGKFLCPYKKKIRKKNAALINSKIRQYSISSRLIISYYEGGGKSLCFQLPAVLDPGLTLVVSPLVSLVEDQLWYLRSIGINADTLNAASSKDDVKRIHSDMCDMSGTLKLLYVTPEKLAKSKMFMNKLQKAYEMGRFTRLVIDEVHCCSTYGHDFR